MEFRSDMGRRSRISARTASVVGDLLVASLFDGESRRQARSGLTEISDRVCRNGRSGRPESVIGSDRNG
jgi:hypothetical protein